jgi:hypothetical protein
MVCQSFGTLVYFWDFGLQEGQHGVFEVGEAFVTPVVGDVFVHLSQQSLDRIEVRAVGRDEV